MARNLADLSNGLKQINNGIGVGDSQADTPIQLADKLNYNAKITLTKNNDLAGAGLVWNSTTAQLSLGLPDGNILVGKQQLTISNEFTTVGGKLSINQISTSKLASDLSAGKLALSPNAFAVGSSTGQGKEIVIDPTQFSLVDNKLTIRAVPSIAINQFTFNPSALNVPNNNIIVGQISGSGKSVSLGVDFYYDTDGSLRVKQISKIGYAQIDATSTSTLPRLLTATNNPDGTITQAWVDNANALSGLIEQRLADSASIFTFYVNSQTGDDSYKNTGTSSLKAFKTIQRATIELTRKSYVDGVGNTPSQSSGADLYDRAVIYLAPGIYPIDNRPGLVDGSTLTPLNVAVAPPAIDTTGYYKYNSVDGGVILPRGCSLIGSDPRKCKVYPTYVPTVSQARAAIFRLSGGCYVSGVLGIDNPNIVTSHHRTTLFEFASSADLNIYYAKIFKVFSVSDNWSANGGPNLQALIQESTIVSNSNSSTDLDYAGFKLVDDVYGSSAYLDKCAVRSRFGLCGVLADGNRVSGLKSLIVSQCAVVSLQVDATLDSTVEDTRHFGFKAINDSYVQVGDCSVIASAVHYWTGSGGQIISNNSTSSFGKISLYAEGYSSNSLLPDTGFVCNRILPPSVIPYNVQTFAIGSLDTGNCTPTSISVRTLLNNDPLRYLNNTYIYVTVADPTNIQNVITLQAKLIATGSTTSTDPVTGVITFNVTNGLIDDTTGNADVNSINQYLNCLGNYNYYSSWHIVNVTTPVGLASERVNQVNTRKQLLNNSDISVQRIIDTRTPDAQKYQLIITVPPNNRQPIGNYIFDRPEFRTANHAYNIGSINSLPANALAGQVIDDPLALTGNNYLLTLLRANRPDVTTLSVNGKLLGDQAEDLGVTNSYIIATSNLDPKLVLAASLASYSYDPQDITYLTLKRLFGDLGYSASTITSILTPRPGDILPRMRTLPNVGTAVVNSQFTFNLVKPSTLTATNHTWQNVGYGNYSAGLPNLQKTLLSENDLLVALQTVASGGRIYATGMADNGRYYVGKNLLNIATGQQQTVRFDGSLANTSLGSLPQSLTNFSVLGTLRAANIEVSGLKPVSILFQGSSNFKVLNGNSYIPLTDSSIPSGIQATTTQYGLTRVATNPEVLAGSGSGYVIPVDLQTVIGNTITGINNTLGVQLNTLTNNTTANLSIGLNSLHTTINSEVYPAIQVEVANRIAGDTNIITDYGNRFINQQNQLNTLNSGLSTSLSNVSVGFQRIVVKDQYIQYGRQDFSFTGTASISFSVPFNYTFGQVPVVVCSVQALANGTSFDTVIMVNNVFLDHFVCRTIALFGGAPTYSATIVWQAIGYNV